MENNNENNKFEYSYTAPTETERRQISAIRRQYEINLTDNESKIERIKYLDNKVKNTSSIFALVMGIIGCLIFGLGLAMVLEWNILIWGIVLMLVGAIPCVLAYPLFKRIETKLKNKYRDEILKLSEELLNN